MACVLQRGWRRRAWRYDATRDAEVAVEFVLRLDRRDGQRQVLAQILAGERDRVGAIGLRVEEGDVARLVIELERAVVGVERAGPLLHRDLAAGFGPQAR